jgi:ABC-type sulfate transport system substrate-binding protein
MKWSTFRQARDTGWRSPVGWLLGSLLVIMVAIYGISALVNSSHTPIRLVVFGFSTQEETFTQGIFPAFEKGWQAETGQNLTIEGVFGPSGTLAGQINLGAPADVAILSNIQHVNWLRLGHKLRRDNQAVIIGCTPMVVVTRQDNPAGISEMADLAGAGLRLLHADPRSSGAGEWAVLAEYGSAFMTTGDAATAKAQLMAIWRNVRMLTPSGRDALTLFELGTGDALITYEQDARLGMDRGVPLEIVIPAHTVVAQPVAVIVDDNVTSSERPVVEAFVQYLASDAGQQILGRYHLRSVNCQNDHLPPLIQPFTVEDLGGWSQANTDLMEALWQTEIEPRLDLEAAPKLLGAGE